MSEASTKKRVGPVTFFKQVQAEARKITWTSRKETVAATIMVVAMVVIAAAFFFVTDGVVGLVVRFVGNVGAVQ